MPDSLMTQVRNLLDDGAAPITLDEVRHRTLSEPLHTSRRRWPVLAAASLAVACAAVVTWAAVTAGDQRNRVVSGPASTSTYENSSRGISVQYPDGWQVATELLTPHLGLPDKPYEVAALGTFPMAVTDHRCAQVPVNAIEDMTATDAFVWIGERFDYPTGTYGPRPATIAADNGIESEPGSDLRVGPDSCFTHPIAGTVRTFAFEDNGRNIYAHVVVGSKATPERAAQAYEILNSLTVSPT
jgi:hypothetical protein